MAKKTSVIVKEAIALYFKPINTVINFIKRPSRSQMLVAATNGSVATIQKAINTGADLNVTNIFGSSILMIAAMHGHEEIVRILLKNKNININTTNAFGENALYFALSNHNIDIIYLFLDTEIEINSVALAELVYLVNHYKELAEDVKHDLACAENCYKHVLNKYNSTQKKNSE